MLFQFEGYEELPPWRYSKVSLMRNYFTDYYLSSPALKLSFNFSAIASVPATKLSKLRLWLIYLCDLTKLM